MGEEWKCVVRYKGGFELGDGNGRTRMDWFMREVMMMKWCSGGNEWWEMV